MCVNIEILDLTDQTNDAEPNLRYFRCSDRANGHCFWAKRSEIWLACLASENDLGSGSANVSANPVENGSGICYPWTWTGCASDAQTLNASASGTRPASVNGNGTSIWSRASCKEKNKKIFRAC